MVVSMADSGVKHEPRGDIKSTEVASFLPSFKWPPVCRLIYYLPLPPYCDLGT